MASRQLVRNLAIGAVLLLMVVVPAASVKAAGQTPIAYGDTVTGQLGGKNYYQLYQFEGTSGDHVLVTMTSEDGLDPYLALVDVAADEVLIEDDDSAGNSNAQFEYDLASSGLFVIIATRYDFDTGTSEGSYTLHLEGGAGASSTTSNVNVQQNDALPITEPQMVAEGTYLMGTVAIGDQVFGEITEEMPVQLYEVQVESDARITIAMLAFGDDLDPYLMFINAAGEVRATDDNSGATIEGAHPYDAQMWIHVNNGGTFRIAATRAGAVEGQTVGAYTLGILDASDDAPPSQEPAGLEMAGEIAVGDTVTGTITNETFTFWYGFKGNAGDQVTITVAGSGGLDPYVGLLDSDTNVLAEDDDSGGGPSGLDAQISAQLPETGQYSIIVTRAGISQGTTTGDYTLTVTAASEASAINSGLSGFSSRAIETDEGTLYLRGSGATHNPAKLTPIQQLLESQPVQLP